MNNEGQQESYTAILGGVIRGLRRARGLSQAVVARAIYVDRSRYSKLERGHGVWTVEQVVLLAPVLGVDAAELYEQASRLHKRFGPPQAI